MMEKKRRRPKSINKTRIKINEKRVLKTVEDVDEQNRVAGDRAGQFPCTRVAMGIEVSVEEEIQDVFQVQFIFCLLRNLKKLF